MTVFISMLISRCRFTNSFGRIPDIRFALPIYNFFWSGGREGEMDFARLRWIASWQFDEEERYL